MGFPPRWGRRERLKWTISCALSVHYPLRSPAMTRDEEARRAGFLSAADMDAYAAAMEEDHLIETHRDAGSPSPLEMWRELSGLPDSRPLTVAEAAKRENVSAKTIRRRLDALAALDPPGAWKVGRIWRIAPAALDAPREPAQQVADTRSRRGRSAKRPAKGSTSTRWEL